MTKRRILGCYTETEEKTTFTYGGWDGTGYNGEGKKQRVWRRANDTGKYVCKYMPCFHAYCILKIDESYKHPVTGLPQAFFENDYEHDVMKTVMV